VAKRETSGHFQLIKSISIDCDADTLLIKVDRLKPPATQGITPVLQGNFRE